MSARASGYMKALVVCPNGERITPREKLVGMVLADSHQDRAQRFTYPSVKTLAEDSMCDERVCRRYLSALERKGVIRRLRPANQGRGMQVFYFFPELDEIPKGWQDVPLSISVSARKGDRRGTEGGPKADILRLCPIDERAQEPEQVQPEQKQTPPNPLVNEGEATRKETNAVGTQEKASCQDRDYLGANESRKRPGGAGVSLSDQLRTERSRADEPCMENSDAISGDPSSEITAATDQVMLGCSFTEERLKKKLRAVIVQEYARTDRLGETYEEIAKVMIERWKSYTSQGERLRVKWGARRFFSEGYWRETESWPWDAAVLREEHIRAEASAGSYTPQ